MVNTVSAVPQSSLAETHFFVHSLAVAKNFASSFFINCIPELAAPSLSRI